MKNIRFGFVARFVVFFSKGVKFCGKMRKEIISIVFFSEKLYLLSRMRYERFSDLVGFLDEREVTALLLHEGLTFADELDLAGRVDCGDILDLNV